MMLIKMGKLIPDVDKYLLPIAIMIISLLPSLWDLYQERKSKI